MNEQRTTVFLDRYAMKGPDGQPIETTPYQMWARVADAIGDTHQERGEFNSLLEDFKFVPGGRILAGAGVDAEVTFYNCYVIPVETKARRHLNYVGMEEAAYGPADAGADSREAIIDTVGLMVDIMSRGGGVGINWSVLRPSGAYLKTVNGTSSGPVGWMNFASVAVGTVEQGGSRRGAAMFMLDDWHPDLLKFIDAKRDNSLITNANVSVAVSDEFMRRVKEDLVWNFCFPDTTAPEYNAEWDGNLNGWLDKGLPVKMYDSMPAREVWRKLAEAAHASGEPGVVFLDRYNQMSTGRDVERLISVNPCGEQGLGPYSVCNLGAMNLDAYIVEKPPVKKVGKGKMALTVETITDTATGRTFDYGRFADDVKVAVRFLDNVIDKNYYFIPENEAIQKRLRRIGLSVMGLADALAALGLRYGSQGAVDFTEAVFRVMKESAIDASMELAKEKGPAPAWSPDMADRPYLKDYRFREQLRETGLRNLFLLTQAPTGTTSTLAGVNSGIEPFFRLSYTRKDRTGEHKVVVGALEKYQDPGVYRGGEWVTAEDVTVEEHIAMQAAVQKYVDSSVSKTINAPADQSVEETAKAYDLAYRSGLKGLAYYRDGSRDVQVLYADKAEKFQHIDWCQGQGAFGAEDCDCPETDREARMMRRIDELLAQVEGLEERVAIQSADLQEYVRPERLKGETMRVRTLAGTAYVTVNRDDKDVAREVFFTVGKAGTDIHGLAEGLGRLASLALRKGASLGGVANQLEGVGGSGNFNRPLAAALGMALTELNVRSNLTPAGNAPIGSKDLLSALAGLPVYKSPAIPSGAIYMGVDKAKGRDKTFTHVYVPEAEEDYTVQQQEERKASGADLCPDCGNVSLVRQEGCSKCALCGYSAC